MIKYKVAIELTEMGANLMNRKTTVMWLESEHKMTEKELDDALLKKIPAELVKDKYVQEYAEFVDVKVGDCYWLTITDKKENSTTFMIEVTEVLDDMFYVKPLFNEVDSYSTGFGISDYSNNKFDFNGNRIPARKTMDYKLTTLTQEEQNSVDQKRKRIELYNKVQDRLYDMCVLNEYGLVKILEILDSEEYKTDSIYQYKTH